MPSSTPKQARLMAAVGNNPQFASKAGVPQKVGKEFNKADQMAKAAALRKPKGPSAPKIGNGPPGSTGGGWNQSYGPGGQAY